MGLQVQGTLRIVLEVVDANVGAATAKATNDVNRLEASVRKSGETASKAGVGFKDLAGAFTTLTVARTIADGLLGMISPAIELEAGMARLRAETGGTADELERMQKEALRAAALTAFSPTEAIEGMTALRKASLDADSAIAAIVPTMQLAQAGAAQGLTVAESARTAGLLFKQFGAEGAELKLMMDQLASASQLFGFRLKDTENMVGRLGEASSRSGANFRDLLITFGLASRQIPTNTRLAGELTRTLENLSDAGKRTELMRAFGLETVDKGTGRLKNMNRALAELAEGRITDRVDFQDKLKGVGFTAAGLRPVLAGLDTISQGMRGANGEFLTGVALVEAMEKHLDGAAGTLQKVSDITLSALGPALEAAREEFMGFLAELGMPTLKVFSNVLKEVMGVFRAFVFVLQLPVIKQLSQAIFGVSLVVATMGIAVAVAMAVTRLLGAAVAFTTQSLAAYTTSTAAATVGTNAMTAASSRATMVMWGQNAATTKAGMSAALAGSRFGQMALVIASGIAGFAFGSSVLKGIAHVLGNDVAKAELEAIEQTGYLNSLLQNMITLMTHLGFITDAQAAVIADKVNRAVGDATSLQDKYNTELERYIELTSIAAKVEYPPRVQLQHLREATTALERLTRAQSEVTRNTAQAGLAALRESDRLFTLGRQRQLTTEEFALLKQKVLEAETAFGSLGPSMDKHRDRLNKMQDALQAVGTDGNLRRSEIARAQGSLPYAVGPEAELIDMPTRARPAAAAPATPAQDPSIAARERARAEMFAAQVEVNRLARASRNAALTVPITGPIGAAAATAYGVQMMEAVMKFERAAAKFAAASGNMRVSLDVNTTNDVLGEGTTNEGNRAFDGAEARPGRRS